MGYDGLGRVLISIAIVLLIIGSILLLVNRIGINRMPGDIYIKKGNFSFYFPIVTSIIVSIVLSIIIFIINRFR